MTIASELYRLIKGLDIFTFTKGYIKTPSAVKTVNTTIDVGDLTGTLLVVGSSGNVDCTSIAQGASGQFMTLMGTDNTNTVTIKNTTTNVKLNGGVDFTLGLGDNMALICLNLGAGLTWYETTRCNLS